MSPLWQSESLYPNGLPVRAFPPQPLPNSAHSDEKLFVLTDIHGSYQAMTRLLSYKPSDARLVFLGDAVDRGDNSISVLKELDKDKEAILIKGNHDIMARYSIHNDANFSERKLKTLQRIWIENNGGMTTIREFYRIEQEKHHDISSDPYSFIQENPDFSIFDAVYDRMQRYWISGNLLFVHGGLPYENENEYLEKNESHAVDIDCDAENHWAWYRPFYEDDGWCDTHQRVFDSKNVYTVSGHTPNDFSSIIHPYGMFMDTGYSLKTAAYIDGNQVSFIVTPCNEVRPCDERHVKIFEE